MTEATTSSNKLRLKCPHCGHRARVRHSRELSSLYREGIVECQNIAECGWRGRVSVAYEAELTPSVAPNPEIALPRSSYIRSDSPNAVPASLQDLPKEEQLDFLSQLDKGATK